MTTIPQIIQYSFFLSAILYSISLGCACLRKNNTAGVFLVGGLLLNLVSIGMRYYITLPMMPLYQGPFFIPFFIGILLTKKVWSGDDKGTIVLFLISLLSWGAVFFPNTHYLPFIQFKTLLAHLFFIFGVMGKAFFLIAGAYGCHYLKQTFRVTANSESALQIDRFVLWGFSLWTLSIFSGAIWSYLGWGSPIVWDDPVITTAMATWLYYGLFLHLHLMVSFGKLKNRPLFAVLGAVWVFLFNCLPDMGKLMVPRF